MLVHQEDEVGIAAFDTFLKQVTAEGKDSHRTQSQTDRYDDDGLPESE